MKGEFYNRGERAFLLDISVSIPHNARLHFAPK
jgi:hypothetical protein